jgi:hypothetical protein
MKEAVRGKKGLLGGLSGQFDKLGLAITPFLGKAGLYAALGIGVAASAKKFVELDDALADFISSQKKRQKAAKTLQDSTDALLEKVKEKGIEELARGRDVTPRKAAMDIVWRQRRAAEEQWRGRSIQQKAADFWTGKKPPEILPFYEQVRQTPAQRAGTLPPELAPPGIPGITDLTEELHKLLEQMQRNQTDNLPSPGVGDPFDSGDSLLRTHADGNLTTGE